MVIANKSINRMLWKHFYKLLYILIIKMIHYIL